MNGKPIYTKRPPLVEDALMEVLNKHRTMPVCMPNRHIDACQWWIGHQKPMGKDEWPRQVGVNGSDGQRWETPYISRCKVNLQKFLKLKPADQDFIIGATEDGVWWNGGDMNFFHGLYEEAMVQKDVGVDKYRRRASKAARGLLTAFK